MHIFAICAMHSVARVLLLCVPREGYWPVNNSLAHDVLSIVRIEGTAGLPQVVSSNEQAPQLSSRARIFGETKSPPKERYKPRRACVQVVTSAGESDSTPKSASTTGAGHATFEGTPDLLRDARHLCGTPGDRGSTLPIFTETPDRCGTLTSSFAGKAR